MASSAVAEAAAAGSLARIEAMLATGNAELVERLEAQAKALRGLAAEVIDLRAQVADGKARAWLSINATARRFDVSRAEVLRRIAAGEVTTRPIRAPGGADTYEVQVASARALWGGA